MKLPRKNSVTQNHTLPFRKPYLIKSRFQFRSPGAKNGPLNTGHPRPRPATAESTISHQPSTPQSPSASRASRSAANRPSTFKFQPAAPQSAFTLAEVLAALIFLAIVIPVVVQGLSLASRTGASASRRYHAALIAERLLNESILMTNWTASGLGGTVHQGQIDYRWKLRTEWWSHDPNITTIRLLSVDVTYPMQGQDHQLTLSTLVDEYDPLQLTNQIVAW